MGLPRVHDRWAAVPDTGNVAQRELTVAKGHAPALARLSWGGGRPSEHLTWTEVVLYNRRTGQLRHLDRSDGQITDVAAGQVNGNWAACVS